MKQRYQALFFTMALLLFSVQAANGWIPPWVRLSLNSGATDNLFADSIGVSDTDLTLSMEVEQPLTPALWAYYSGSRLGYTNTVDLGNFYNEAGMDLETRYGHLESLWLTAGLSDLSYGELYSLYNQRNIFSSAGFQLKTAETSRFRGRVEWGTTSYPSYSDSLSVDHSDLEGGLGANLAFPWPLAVDIESGLHQRLYSGMETAASTSYLYADLRLSRPLDTLTGISVNLSYRNQLENNTSDLYTLYLNGLDPGELLWDGWSGRLSLNRYLVPWKAALSLAYRHARYVETSATITDLQREDRGFELSLSAKRSLPLNTLPFRLWISGSYSLLTNDSSISYYTYTANQFLFGLSIESLW